MHRTTIRLDEHLLVQTKEYAARHRRTVTAVIEDALRALLARSSAAPGADSGTPKTRRLRLPVSRETGGPLPGVNLDSYGELLDVMEAGAPIDKRR